jgi:hypothetical protein
MNKVLYAIRLCRRPGLDGWHVADEESRLAARSAERSGALIEGTIRIRLSNYARAGLRGGLSFYVRCYPERFFGL